TTVHRVDGLGEGLVHLLQQGGDLLRGVLRGGADALLEQVHLTVGRQVDDLAVLDRLTSGLGAVGQRAALGEELLARRVGVAAGPGLVAHLAGRRAAVLGGAGVVAVGRVALVAATRAQREAQR